jgi:chromosomal replication initiation ATPase DnaA
VALLHTDLACTSCGRLVHLPGTPPSVELVQETVAAHYRIPLDQLQGTRRDRHIVLPRQVAMFLVRELTSLSLPAIGRAFGGKDHTTVLHACQKVLQLSATDSRLQRDLRLICDRLRLPAPEGLRRLEVSTAAAVVVMERLLPPGEERS